MKYFIAMLVALILLAGCSSENLPEQKKESTQVKNIFNDTVIRTIYTLQNQRDTAGLLNYFSHKNKSLRSAAALAFASVQSPEAATALAALLKDPEESVRTAAVYALGQTLAVQPKEMTPAGQIIETALIDGFASESSNFVRRDILEAIGKLGTKKGLQFIVDLNFEGEAEPALLLTGQARGLYRAALRNRVSETGTALAFSLLTRDRPQEARFAAAHYLARARNIDLNAFSTQLIKAYDNEEEIFVKMALVNGMGKAKVPQVLEKLKNIIAADIDSRIKVNALRAMGRFDDPTVFQLLLETTAHKNVSLAITASEFFLGNVTPDYKTCFEKGKQLTNWRSRANMLSAALKSAPEKEKKARTRISDWISAAMRKTSDPYEKAWLLQALAWELGNVDFIQARTFVNVGKHTIISSNGITALTAMYRRAKAAKKIHQSLQNEFNDIFKRAVLSGDTSMMTAAADLLRDPKMEFKSVFKEFVFLNEALSKCQLPQQMEAWEALKKTIDFFTAKNTAARPTLKKNAAQPKNNRAIDWRIVSTIAADKRIKIKTTKGDIIIQLKVNDSPGSVENFVSLIRRKFYKRSLFHRVVPNFVIQDGCPRGDGWGGPTYTIGSELGPLTYSEGTVGMASSGKDTEGSQWFITHSPTPHLDGRYTVFAKVVSGMDVVLQIQVGDRVLGFQEL